MSILLISFLHVGWDLERSFSAHFPDDSYAIYTKGLEMSQLMSVVLISTSCFGWDLERSLCACTHSHGLERTGVLKGLQCNSLVPLSHYAIYLQARVLK